MLTIEDKLQSNSVLLEKLLSAVGKSGEELVVTSTSKKSRSSSSKGAKGSQSTGLYQHMEKVRRTQTHPSLHVLFFSTEDSVT